MSFTMFEQTWTFNDGIGDKDGNSLTYNEIIQLLHPEIQWQFQYDDDYQGDFFCAGFNNKTGHWYFIQGSFGSCSGCDWLQSINDEEDAKKLLNHYKKEIIEKNNKKEIIAYMTDTKQNASWSAETIVKLITKIQTLETPKTKHKPSDNFDTRIAGLFDSP